MYVHLAKDDYCEAVQTAQHEMRDRRQGGTPRITDEDWNKLLNRIANEIAMRVQQGRRAMTVRVTLTKGSDEGRGE